MSEERSPGQGVDHNQESFSSSSDDDSLVLEGTLVRNLDVESSSDESIQQDETEQSNDKKRTKLAAKKPKAKRQKSELDVIQVEFIFCDMQEKYFGGLKALLHSSGTVYQPHSSALADIMIDNAAVGTVVSTEGDDSIFGFASVINLNIYQDWPAIQYLKQICLKDCPKERKDELEVVFSGKTNRPAGFLLHSRMINMPLEIVQVMHEQLVLDMDWAVDNADGGEAGRKSHDFGVFVRVAPCQQEGSSVVYRYFDDEIFAGQAEFVYTLDAPKAYSNEEKQLINVMVLTKTGHHAALKDLAKMIGNK